MLPPKRIHRVVRDGRSVEVTEMGGVRSLFLGSRTLQSSMRVSSPDELVLDYTRAMMAFPLFREADPRRAVLVGLGGGSLARFLRARMPTTDVTAVEIRPEVVEVAREFFSLPETGERFRVVLGDGHEFLAAHRGRADLIMVDAFDERSQAEGLATPEFYLDARDGLEKDGLMVVNLWGSDARFETFLDRIQEAFAGQTLCLPVTHTPGNVIVFAFRRSPGPLAWDRLKDRARHLAARLGLDFPGYVEALRRMNLHTGKYLLT